MRVAYVIYDSNGKQDYVGALDSYGLKYHELRKITSSNLGNLLFKYAARKLLADETEVVYVTYSDDPEEYKSSVDMIVLPEANLVNPNLNYQKQANLIKFLDKPVFLLGVGAQAETICDANDFPSLKSGTLDFLNQVSKRTPFIFVRGEFTKKILISNGITNVKALGCPSYLINSSPFLWRNFETKSQKHVMDRLSITEGVYPTVKRTQLQDKAERFLFQSVIYNNADYVGQTQISIVKCGLGFLEELETKNVDNLRKYLSQQLGLSEFRRLIIDRSKAFSRVDSWLNYNKTRSALIGTRIHGNISALQSGTPCLPVTHDSRTKELCLCMKIPHIDVAHFENIYNISEIIDLFDVFFAAKYNELDEHRQFIANEYIETILNFGLSPSASLRSIVTTDPIELIFPDKKIMKSGPKKMGQALISSIP